MKRYQTLANSQCLFCKSWLCVMVGTYSGEIVCDKCGAPNIFRDTSTPVEAAFPRLAEGSNEALSRHT